MAGRSCGPREYSVLRQARCPECKKNFTADLASDAMPPKGLHGKLILFCQECMETKYKLLSACQGPRKKQHKDTCKKRKSGKTKPERLKNSSTMMFPGATYSTGEKQFLKTCDRFRTANRIESLNPEQCFDAWVEEMRKTYLEKCQEYRQENGAVFLKPTDCFFVLQESLR